MIVHIIQGLLVLAALVLIVAGLRKFARAGVGFPGPVALFIGAAANFFDTLGIGSFAPTTAAIKFLRLTDDENIPGTLNVGHALPTLTEALIFIAIIKVDVSLLLACIVAAVAGALIGAGIVTRLPARAIRASMGVALLVAAGLYAAQNIGAMPGGGSALALSGAAFVAAIALHFLFGALMSFGIGLYAPALISLSLLGMDPRAAFPIMMGACAFLMPASSLRFLESGRLSPRLALGFALGGIPAVLFAAFIIKEMPLDALRWLVTGVVLLAAAMLLAEAAQPNATKSRAY
ncbi:MAG: permease [Alphaproteobacteria bacterium]|nr:permease [Alphaproteobacteria bacterium]